MLSQTHFNILCIIMYYKMFALLAIHLLLWMTVAYSESLLFISSCYQISFITKNALNHHTVLQLHSFSLTDISIFNVNKIRKGIPLTPFWGTIVFLTHIFIIELYVEFTGSSSVTMRGIHTQSTRDNKKNTKSFAKRCYLTSYYH